MAILGIKVEGGISIGNGITIGDSVGPTPPTLLLSLDAADYSGSGSNWTADVGNDATLQNSPSYTAVNPKYFSFSPASSQYATVPAVPSMSTWSVIAWFRATSSLTSQVTTVIGDQFSGGLINYSLAINPTSEGTGVLKAAYYNNSDGGWHLTSGFVPTTNTWYQVVGTYDGTTLKQYQNGTLQSQTTTSAVCAGDESSIRIAARWDSLAPSIDYFPGDISIVKVYSGAIDATAVTNNWNATKSRFGL